MRGNRDNPLNLANIFEVLGAWLFVLVEWNTQFSFSLAHEHGSSLQPPPPPPPNGRAVVMEEEGRKSGRQEMVVAEERGKRRRRRSQRYKWMKLKELKRTNCHHKSENRSLEVSSLHLAGELEEQWHFAFVHFSWPAIDRDYVWRFRVKESFKIWYTWSI